MKNIDEFLKSDLGELIVLSGLSGTSTSRLRSDRPNVSAIPKHARWNPPTFTLCTDLKLHSIAELMIWKQFSEGEVNYYRTLEPDKAFIFQGKLDRINKELNNRIGN